jgi:Ni2+-binding GTPase involved in maturation of urease and hydrogenase
MQADLKEMSDDLIEVKQELKGLRLDITKLAGYDQWIKAHEQAVFCQGA